MVVEKYDAIQSVFRQYVELLKRRDVVLIGKLEKMKEVNHGARRCDRFNYIFYNRLCHLVPTSQVDCYPD